VDVYYIMSGKLPFNASQQTWLLVSPKGHKPELAAISVLNPQLASIEYV